MWGAGAALRLPGRSAVTQRDTPRGGEFDKVLRSWRQGDCVLGEQWFLFRLAIDSPVTEEALAAAAEMTDAAEAAVRGLIVVTQTCDIVRPCRQRPFLQVCPLVEVDGEMMDQIRRCHRPNYAYVPGVAELGLVADLDRVMRVEKPLLLGWNRTRGCRSDDERRRFALALARKRERFAFPDDFVRLVEKLQRRLQRKHDRSSAEGQALRALREIRVRASSSWDASRVEIFFWFIEEDATGGGDYRWHELLEQWLALAPPSGRFIDVQGQVVTLEAMTARAYVDSDPLDLDHLTTRP
jgi:hypothetical protein